MQSHTARIRKEVGRIRGILAFSRHRLADKLIAQFKKKERPRAKRLSPLIS
jgi:hypothetical protein